MFDKIDSLLLNKLFIFVFILCDITRISRIDLIFTDDVYGTRNIVICIAFKGLVRTTTMG